MLNYEWKIKAIDAKNGILIKVKYYVKASNEEVFADTEGYWVFEKDYEINDNILESEIASWVRQETMKDSVNTIEYALETQINALKGTNSIELPWIANTFTME
jgi:hypothetical protein